jgi:hypothetical protein
MADGINHQHPVITERQKMNEAREAQQHGHEAPETGPVPAVSA